MPKIVINDKEYQVEDGLTIIQVCDSLGIQIPRFCYHDKLPIVGSCRMCLVSVKGAPKLMPACSTNVYEGLEFATENNAIDDARRSMLELLLYNHPLDCPICDQGGECDLQDQTYRYGLDKSDIVLNKRAVAKKDFGPLIENEMTRCIHCTRCIRFATEIAGVDALGGIGRGDLTEINNYVTATIESELSGNLADICPVGALTNADYSYKARPWELRSVYTIDIMDAMCSNTVVDSQSTAVLRILPRQNANINEDWLADKSRYITDSLRVQRLDQPMIRMNNKLQVCTWDEAFTMMANKLQMCDPKHVACLVGDFVNLETMCALKQLFLHLNVESFDCRQNSVQFDINHKADYLFNTQIANIEESDLCLIIGANLRKEAPLLNARIRKRYLQGNYSIAVIGDHVDLKYNYEYLGDNLAILNELLVPKRKQHSFVNKLLNAKKPVIILGESVLLDEDCQKIIDVVKQLAVKYNAITADWCGYNMLNSSVTVLNGLFANFVHNNISKNAHSILQDIRSHSIKFLWLVNEDNFDFSQDKNDMFVVYQGHHGDQGAKFADVILPMPTWLEQDGSYINIEGRLQFAKKAASKLGNAKESWKIVRKFAEYLHNVHIQYNTLDELRKMISLMLPYIEYNKDNYIINTHLNVNTLNALSLDSKTVSLKIKDYYLTDVISRNSVKMTECSRLINKT